MNKLKLCSLVLTALSGLLSIATVMVDDKKQEQRIEEKVREEVTKQREES